MKRSSVDAHLQADLFSNGNIEIVLSRQEEKIDRLELQDLDFKDPIDLLLAMVCSDNDAGLARKQLLKKNLHPSVKNDHSAHVRRKLFYGT